MNAARSVSILAALAALALALATFTLYQHPLLEIYLSSWALC